MAGLVTCQLLAWLTWLCLVAAKAPADALKITPDRIPTLVEAHDKVLVTFCSPYGYHCKRFLPELESTQQLLDREYPNQDVIIAHVDCVEFSDYCSDQDIRSYPTLRVYKGSGTSFEAFTGRRQRYEIVSYLIDGIWPTSTSDSLKGIVKPANWPELTPAELESFVYSHKRVVVIFCTPQSFHCRQMYSEIQKAQELVREHDTFFANIDCTQFHSYCDHRNIRTYPWIHVYSGDPRTWWTFRGPKTKDDLVSYLIDGAWPTTPAADVLRTSSAIPTPGASVDNTVSLKTDGSEADVKLELPGLPINLPTVPEDLKASSSVVLRFNFTDDGKQVMLNGEVLALQVPNPSVPALLTARQVPLDYDIQDINLTSVHSRWAHGEFKTVGIDYEMYGRSRDDPNIYYYNYHPEIVINLIGCSSPDPVSYQPDFLLDSLDQQVIKIKFHDVQGNGQSGDPNRSYRIESITLHARSQESGYRPRINHPSFEPYRVPRPDDRPCSRWSWRCADIGNPPWYRFIWRQNFDEFGRIGSLRWRWSRWYTSIVKPVLDTVIPPVWIWFLLTVLAVYFRLGRPLFQLIADQREEEKTRSND